MFPYLYILVFFKVFALYAAVNPSAECPLSVGLLFAAPRVPARRL